MLHRRAHWQIDACRDTGEQQVWRCGQRTNRIHFTHQVWMWEPWLGVEALKPKLCAPEVLLGRCRAESILTKPPCPFLVVGPRLFSQRFGLPALKSFYLSL